MRSYDAYRGMMEEALSRTLRGVGQAPDRLMQAMDYSLSAGGKRIRPVMLLAACEMAGGTAEEALPFACALEMLHTYSLIHDDLPAMDNDDLRRGKPTNHKVFGEDLAILAGDGLLNSAAEIMARAALERPDRRGVQAMEAILRHAGAGGMIAGQVYDLSAEGKTPSPETLKRIHAHKTADLLQAPMEAGLRLAGAPEERIADGLAYGYHFGMAFQIIDDLLDVIGDAGLLGKQTGMDAAMGKMTWVGLRGVEGAREDARKETEAATAAAKRMAPWETAFFVRLAEETLTRVQ